jgi:hypothetical protein
MTSYIQPLVQPIVDAAKAVPGTVVAKASIALGSQPLSSLCSPMQLGDLTLRNRNIMASLTRNRSTPTTVPNDANIVRVPSFFVFIDICANQMAALLQATC